MLDLKLGLVFKLFRTTKIWIWDVDSGKLKDIRDIHLLINGKVKQELYDYSECGVLQNEAFW